MAISTAALQAVARAFDSVSKKEEGKPGILTESFIGAAICLVLVVAAAVSIITAPVAWADQLMQQFKQNYSYIVSGGGNGSASGVTDNTDYSHITDNMNVSEQRKSVVVTALSLEGKVGYFWGGKSSAIGWDDRWGQYTRVSAAGSPTTGTMRPFGLDCSGYVDWVFNNALGYVISHGAGAQSQYDHCTPISWSEAQPGDLVFFTNCDHVGIVVENDGGTLSIAHCSSGHNNVVVMKQSAPSASCFLFAGRPDIF